MCLAIYKPAGVSIPKEHLEQGFENNSDGAGLCFPYNRRVEILKGFFAFESFYKTYLDVQAYPLLVHFRLRTSGNKDEVNCHPWRIDDKHAMIHNGVLDHPSTATRSDTGCFTEDILKPLWAQNRQWWRTRASRRVMEMAIGRTNKIAVLDHKGHCVIWGEAEGEWKDGVWYSNSSYDYRGYYGAAWSNEDWQHWSRRTTVKVKSLPLLLTADERQDCQPDEVAAESDLNELIDGQLGDGVSTSLANEIAYFRDQGMSDDEIAEHYGLKLDDNPRNGVYAG
jgi:hypothetical protein